MQADSEKDENEDKGNDGSSTRVEQPTRSRNTFQVRWWTRAGRANGRRSFGGSTAVQRNEFRTRMRTRGTSIGRTEISRMNGRVSARDSEGVGDGDGERGGVPNSDAGGRWVSGRSAWVLGQGGGVDGWGEWEGDAPFLPSATPEILRAVGGEGNSQHPCVPAVDSSVGAATAVVSWWSGASALFFFFFLQVLTARDDGQIHDGRWLRWGAPRTGTRGRQIGMKCANAGTDAQSLEARTNSARTLARSIKSFSLLGGRRAPQQPQQRQYSPVAGLDRPVAGEPCVQEKRRALQKGEWVGYPGRFAGIRYGYVPDQARGTGPGGRRRLRAD
ncbi:hypothetical protein DFP72DRAFT_1050220 [Ephemerocybe angulata]|uniref:Uncharacterized protein n=1 Tax=Ephemerocybe angulata TaxID=980116 RepID=A0A8H6HJ85_9AGAR|nr:hypothetical protein DFP72DRAFT_1050220 [Tulosesus angulatus]